MEKKQTQKHKVVYNPGPVDMGDDSCSKDLGLESRRHILDGHFFTLICCKNCNVVFLKRSKINEKEAGVGPFKQTQSCTTWELTMQNKPRGRDVTQSLSTSCCGSLVYDATIESVKYDRHG